MRSYGEEERSNIMAVFTIYGEDLMTASSRLLLVNDHSKENFKNLTEFVKIFMLIKEIQKTTLNMFHKFYFYLV